MTIDSRPEFKPERRTKHWLEYAIFVFVVLTAAATGYAAYYTRQQWLTAQDTEVRQLRAYVSVSLEPGIRVDDQKTTLSIDNFGQSPATDVHIFGQWEFVRYEEDLPPDFTFPDKPRNCDNSTSTLGQNIAFSVVSIFPRTPTRATNFFCPGTYASLQRAVQRELNAFLYGHLDYLDIFNIRRQSTFCFLWLPAQQMALNCSRHNEIDPEN
jgi:hypothetical protein